jgi:hypothetical protein
MAWQWQFLGPSRWRSDRQSARIPIQGGCHPHRQHGIYPIMAKGKVAHHRYTQIRESFPEDGLGREAQALVSGLTAAKPTNGNPLTAANLPIIRQWVSIRSIR